MLSQHRRQRQPCFSLSRLSIESDPFEHRGMQSLAQYSDIANLLLMDLFRSNARLVHTNLVPVDLALPSSVGIRKFCTGSVGCSTLMWLCG